MQGLSDWDAGKVVYRTDNNLTLITYVTI